MSQINRSVAIVRPRRPFVDWANRLDDDGPEYIPETAVFLIPECETDEDAQGYLGSNFRKIAEEVFSTWSRDPETWPRLNSYRTFRRWFSVECIDAATDLGATRISNDIE